MRPDRRITLALVAVLGMSLGWLLPITSSNHTTASVEQLSSTVSRDYTSLANSLDELQLLVAKLEPPQTKSPEFETVLESCSKECICPDCPRCDANVEQLSSTVSNKPVEQLSSTVPSKPVTEGRKPSGGTVAPQPASTASVIKPSVVKNDWDNRSTLSYTPRWTHPSTIEDHMVSHHGVSTVGKTREQLYAEHDAIHDAERSRSVSVTTSRQSYSSCPGGVCPVPSRTTRTVAPVRPFRVFRR
jgi:hypothetical protein